MHLERVKAPEQPLHVAPGLLGVVLVLDRLGQHAERGDGRAKVMGDSGHQLAVVPPREPALPLGLD